MGKLLAPPLRRPPLDVALCGDALLTAVPGHVLVDRMPPILSIDEAKAIGHALLTLAESAEAQEREQAHG